MAITNYGFYKIRCTFGGTQPAAPFAGYLHAPHARRDPVEITQWTSDPKRPEPYDEHHFHWMLVEADEPAHYYIVNRRSGLPLMVPVGDSAPQVRQDAYSPRCDAQFRFVLEPAGDGPESMMYSMISYFSGFQVGVSPHPKAAPTTNGLGICAFADPQDVDAKGLATFELQPVPAHTGSADVLRAAKPPRGTAVEPGAGQVSVHQLPKLEALDQELPVSFPERSTASIAASQMIPFFMVDDPGLAQYRQLQESPYYTLRHWQRWDKVLDRQFDGVSERETTETLVVGMTQFDAASFRETFKWSVEVQAKAGYKAGGFSASLSVTSKVEKAVEETRQQSTERVENRTRSELVRYPSLGHAYRVVTWVPVDVYDLARTDERRPLSTWTVTREGEDVTLIHPPATREIGGGGRVAEEATAPRAKPGPVARVKAAQAAGNGRRGG